MYCTCSNLLCYPINKRCFMQESYSEVETGCLDAQGQAEKTKGFLGSKNWEQTEVDSFPCRDPPCFWCIRRIWWTATIFWIPCLIGTHLFFPWTGRHDRLVMIYEHRSNNAFLVKLVFCIFFIFYIIYCWNLFKV